MRAARHIWQLWVSATVAVAAMVLSVMVAGCGEGQKKVGTDHQAAASASSDSSANPSLDADIASPATTESEQPKTEASTKVVFKKLPTTKPAAPATNRYVDYSYYQANKASYAGFKVLIYFHAPWCAPCVTTERRLATETHKIPANMVVVKTDYDKYSSLREKLKVRTTNTCVQINESEQAVKTVVGVYDVAQLVREFG